MKNGNARWLGRENHDCTLLTKKFITSATIDSFSSGFDSAIMMVTATNVLSSTSFLSPSKSTP